MRRLPHQLFFVLIFASVVVSLSAQTETTYTVGSEPKQPTTDMRLGAFLVSGINVSLGLTTPHVVTTRSINLADTLNTDTTASTFRFDGTWNISGRHSIDVSWYDIKITGVRTISKELDFGDSVFPINATINSEYRTTIYKLAYAYTFLRKPKHEVSALIGVHVMRLQTTIGMPERSQFERFSITAPLPVVGVQWKAQWSDKFSTRTSFQFFGISVDDSKYSGHFTDFLVAGEYQFWKWGGLGAGYNQFNLNAELSSHGRVLSTEYAYGGLLAYIFARF